MGKELLNRFDVSVDAVTQVKGDLYTHMDGDVCFLTLQMTDEDLKKIFPTGRMDQSPKRINKFVTELADLLKQELPKYPNLCVGIIHSHNLGLDPSKGFRQRTPEDVRKHNLLMTAAERAEIKKVEK